MFCPNCGNNLEDNAKFCDACGTMIKESEQTPVAEPDKSAPSSVAKPAKPKKSGMGIVLAIIAGLVAVALLIVFVVLPMLEDDTTESDDEQQTSVSEEAETQGSSAIQTETPISYIERVDNTDGSWIDYEYDANGTLLQSTFYNADGSKYSVYIYDSNGDVKSKNYYFNDGEWSESDCNADGYTTKTVYYHADGSVNFWIEFDLAADGTILEEHWFNADGSLMD